MEVVLEAVLVAEAALAVDCRKEGLSLLFFIKFNKLLFDKNVHIKYIEDDKEVYVYVILEK